MAIRMTSRSDSLDSVKDDLTCCFHLDVFVRPKTLPCQHVFCEYCLCTWLGQEGKLRCPECKTEHETPADGAHGLPNNFKLASICDKVKEASEDEDLTEEPDVRSTVDVYPTNVQVKSEISVHIKLRTKSGNHVFDPRACSNVDGIVKSQCGQTRSLKFADSCLAKFVVDDVGEYVIHVRVDEEDVTGSPVSVLATPRDNLTATHSPPDRLLYKPHDITPYETKFVVTNKGMNEVVVLDKEFQLMNRFRSPKEPGMGKFDPYGIACTEDKTFLVTDLANHCVVEFDDFETYRVFGRQILAKPCGIVAGENGNVYVADSAKHCIFVFDKTREHVSVMGEQGSALGQLDYPWFLAMNSEGNLFVADFRNRRIQEWDTRKKNAVRFINVDHGGKAWDCRGIAVDHNDNIYVTVRSGFMRGWSTETVLVYAKSGKFLGKFGEGFNYVRGITVTRERNQTIAYVVDGEHHVIKVYEM